MMIEKVKKLAEKYREQLVYLFIGGITTVISFAVYEVLVFFGLDVVISNVISWIFAVIWAYFGNKIFVFRDKEKLPERVAFQIFKFISSRLFSLGVETALIWLGYEKIGISKFLVKLPVAIFVVILNYITGKLVVFAHPKQSSASHTAPEEDVIDGKEHTPQN
jgi:putative flippase GtrA